MNESAQKNINHVKCNIIHVILRSPKLKVEQWLNNFFFLTNQSMAIYEINASIISLYNYIWISAEESALGTQQGIHD